MGKKIIVVTWIGGGNYGTALQSFALCRKLSSLGYNTGILTGINYSNTICGYLISLLKIFLKKIYVLHILKMLKIKFFNTPKKYNFYKFCYNNYNKIEYYFNFQYQREFKKTDVFITGSDQIWNTFFCFNPTMFLDFVNDKKKIAYASSIGTSQIKDEYKNQVKKYLSEFYKIGVREFEAVKTLSELTGRNDIQQVLDPTFLIDANEWRIICGKCRLSIKLPSNYILVYLIGHNEWYKDQLEVVKHKTGLENVVIIPSEEFPDFSIPGATIYNDADPLDFVNLIDKASFVCTDSFHATAFCINLQKDFVEFLRFKDGDKKSQNSRIYDVLDHFALNNRIYVETNDEWSKHIDFCESSNILEKDKSFSIDYFVNSIEK